ncbi:excalibur calcium-binding domain-containing protein [Paenibacillus mucilaginosus]|nr:excalibur calcium-binding domain-containing protein [Paenibacillus mucilaginosus]
MNYGISQFFIAAGGSARNPHRLDSDNDGCACEGPGLEFMLPDGA